MFEPRSELADDLPSGADGADGRRAIIFHEVKHWHLGLLAGYRGTEAPLEAAVGPALGGMLSSSPRIAQSLPRALVLNVAPRQYWIVTSDHRVLPEVAAVISARTGSLTVLSDSRVRVAITGVETRRMLARGIPIDLHPNSFAVGHFAQTSLHHVGVLIYRASPDQYELFLPRTFAVTLWEWLVDSALLSGYDAHATRPTGIT